ncbi:uncharacterized protein VTP21DRAFT_9041 [Calcarisporiella thermophila]|uniref:uncharacterized protein n=1 Tax=Calcarisporiella thermophila TaxID=911321 RepID=UPI0037438DA9
MGEPDNGTDATSSSALKADETREDSRDGYHPIRISGQSPQQRKSNGTRPKKLSAHHNQAAEDDFQVVENRRGFFDIKASSLSANGPSSMYNSGGSEGIERRSVDIEELNWDDNIQTTTSRNPSPTPSEYDKCPNPTPVEKINAKQHRIHHRLHAKFIKSLTTEKMWHIHKSAVAYTLVSLLTLIAPVAKWLGPFSFMSVLGIVYLNPARTVGAQLEASLLGVFGCVIACIYCMAIRALTAYVNMNNPGSYAGRWVLAIALFVFVFCVTYARITWARLFAFWLYTTIIAIWALTRDVDETVTNPRDELDLSLPIVCGILITLAVNILVHPEMATQRLGKKLNETLGRCLRVLNYTTAAFLLHPSARNISLETIITEAEAMRIAFGQLSDAYYEARNELSYSCFNPTDIKPIKIRISALIQHLSSMVLSLRNQKTLVEEVRGLAQAVGANEDIIKTLLTVEELRRHMMEIEMEDEGGMTEIRRSQSGMTHRTLDKGKSAQSILNFTSLVERPPSASVKIVEPNPEREINGEGKCDERINPSTPSIRSQARTPYYQNYGNENSRIDDCEQNDFIEYLDSENDVSEKKWPSWKYLSKISCQSSSRWDTSSSVTMDETSQYSTSRWSMAALSGIPKKEISFGDRRLLLLYLRGVNEPLNNLSNACESTVQTIQRELVLELGIDRSPWDPNTGSSRTNIRRSLFQSIVYLFRECFPWIFPSQFLPTSEKTMQNRKNSSNFQSTDIQVDQDNQGNREQAGAPGEEKCPRHISEEMEQFDLHTRQFLKPYGFSGDDTEDEKINNGMVDVQPCEELFLVFSFMFSLREAAQELTNLSEYVKTLKEKMERGSQEYGGKAKRKRWWWPRIRLSSWISLEGQSQKSIQGGTTPGYFDRAGEAYGDGDNDNLNGQEGRVGKTSASAKSSVRSFNGDTLRKRKSRDLISSRASIYCSDMRLKGPSPAVLTTALVARQPLWLTYLRHRIWRSTFVFYSYQFRFALKTAACILLLSLPAYFDQTMKIFMQWRGQWAAISAINVINPTVAATINVSLMRLAGTVIGATWANLSWIIDNHNPYVILVMEIILSYVLWYIFFVHSNLAGTVGLITYAVVIFSSYVLVNQPNVPMESVTDIGWQRASTVAIGIVVATLLSWTIWPYRAGEALRKSLANQLYRLGILMNNMVAMTMTGSLQQWENGQKQKNPFQQEEKNIQLEVLRSMELIRLATLEPQIAGPFPREFYNGIINSIQSILNRLFSMRVAMQNIMPEVLREIVTPMATYNRDMIASMLLCFYVLAGSLRNRVPLPPYLPSARLARIRFINKLRTISNTIAPDSPIAMDNQVKLLSYPLLYWYAASSCTEDIIEELETLGLLLRELTNEDSFARMGVHHTGYYSFPIDCAPDNQHQAYKNEYPQFKDNKKVNA